MCTSRYYLGIKHALTVISAKAIVLNLVAFAVLISAQAADAERMLVQESAQLLRSAPSYSWTAMVSPVESTGHRAVEIEGRVEKDGPTSVTLRFGDRTVHGYLLGSKAFVTSPDTKWKDIPEMRKGETPGEFITRLVRGVTPPDKQIRELLGRSAELRQEGEVVTASLPQPSAQALLEPRHAGRFKGPEVRDASGTVKFWTAAGAITKYEYTLRGKTMMDGEEKEFVRTTVVEIRDIGTTKVDLPDIAKEKLRIKERRE